MMDCTLSSRQLSAYVLKQTDHLFPDGRQVGVDEALPAVEKALERMAFSLSHCIWYNKRTTLPPDARPCFNHLYSDQQAVFLAYLANQLAQESELRWMADKVYCLNKALNGIDVGWAVNLPRVMQVVHGLGTVIGRASFADYLMIYQGCTIGGSPELAYPTLGRGVILYAGSRVIGNAHIGDNVIIGAGAQIVDQDVPADSLVFGQSPNLCIRPSQRKVVGEFFNPAGFR